jgi:hypothetical protein
LNIDEQIDSQAIDGNNAKHLIAEENGKLIRLQNKFDHFEKTAKEHLHGEIESRIKILESSDKNATLFNNRVSFLV